MTTLTPRAFRKRLKDEFLAAFEQARNLADEYEWAYGATHAPTVGDEAKIRTVASRPTESIALSGYPDRDDMLRGKAALRRQVDKSSNEALAAIVRLSNALDGESKKLEKAMNYLKPGPSARNPRFELPTRGDLKLPADIMRPLEDAQTRREDRGERFGG